MAGNSKPLHIAFAMLGVSLLLGGCAQEPRLFGAGAGGGAVSIAQAPVAPGTRQARPRPLRPAPAPARPQAASSDAGFPAPDGASAEAPPAPVVRGSVRGTAAPRGARAVRADAAADSDFTFTFQVGDEVEIRVWREPDLTTQQRILRDGTLSPALLPPVPFVGRTIEDVHADLTQRYTEYLVEPKVSVRVVDIFTDRVYVLGEVQDPQAIAIPGPTNVLQAITNAGGFNEEFADKAVVRIVRLRENRRPRVFTVDTQRMLAGRAGLLWLEPGDIVYVHPTGLTTWSRQLSQLLAPIGDSLGVLGDAATTVIALDQL